MRLSKVQITEFQSIRDSNEFEVGNTTCLVGKNEAGKTSLLQALYRLNPINPSGDTYSVTDDYPRRDVEDYRIELECSERNQATVARAVFVLEDDDVSAVEERFGEHALPERVFTVFKGYENKLSFSLKVDTAATLRHLVAEREFTQEVQSALEACDTVATMAAELAKLEQTEEVASLKTRISEIQDKKGLCFYIFNVLLWPRVPKFLYFDEYYQKQGRAQIEALKNRKEAKPAGVRALRLSASRAH